MIGVPAVLKLLSPKIVKGIISYVFDKNDLDRQVDALRNKIAEQDEIIQFLLEKVNGK